MLGTAAEYITLAFFNARISLAASLAAGETGLIGVGNRAGCCAPAGAAAKANPSARPAADKILARLFIPILPGFSASWPFNNANSLRAGQDCGTGKPYEQPVLADAGYDIQQPCQTRSIDYSSKMGIDNPVATIGDKNVAVLALS